MENEAAKPVLILGNVLINELIDDFFASITKRDSTA